VKSTPLCRQVVGGRANRVSGTRTFSVSGDTDFAKDTLDGEPPCCRYLALQECRI
jgi:hypothetical protein